MKQHVLYRDTALTEGSAAATLRALFLTMLWAGVLLSGMAYAQEGTIQTDTLYLGRRPSAYRAGSITEDTDSALVRWSAFFNAVHHTLDYESRAHVGPGIAARFALQKHKGTKGYYLRPAVSYGWNYWSIDVCVLYHFSRTFYVGGGYHHAEFTEEDYYSEAEVSLHALAFGGGVGTGSIYVELQALVPLAPETYEIHITDPWYQEHGFSYLYQDYELPFNVSYAFRFYYYF